MNAPTTFRPIKGFPGYAIGETGEVISFKRREPFFLKPFLTRVGYLFVVLCDGHGAKFNRHVHTLVAQAFLGERPEGAVVDHIDGDKTNNHVINLRYVTYAENTNNINTLSHMNWHHKCRGVVVSKGDSEQKFRSLNRACCELGLQPETVRRGLLQKSPYTTKSGYTFHYEGI